VVVVVVIYKGRGCCSGYENNVGSEFYPLCAHPVYAPDRDPRALSGNIANKPRMEPNALRVYEWLSTLFNSWSSFRLNISVEVAEPEPTATSTEI